MNAKRPLLIFGAPAIALACGLLFAGQFGVGPLAVPIEAVEVELGELDGSHKIVTVSGTAHYPVRISQTHQRGFPRKSVEFHIFPLFPQGNTHDREIYTLIMARDRPDGILGFEDRTITGRVRPVSEVVTPRTLDEYVDEGYAEGSPLWVIEELPPSPE